MNTEYEILGTGQQLKKLMERACMQMMDVYGVRNVELEILFFLAHAGKQDTAKDISNTHHFSKAHISKSVDNLRQRGYIILAEDKEDHRCLHIQITPRGLPVIREYEQIRLQVVEKLFMGVTEEERSCMRNVLKKVMGNIDAELERIEEVPMGSLVDDSKRKRKKGETG